MSEVAVLKNDMGHMKNSLEKIGKDLSEMRREDITARQEFTAGFNNFKLELKDTIDTLETKEDAAKAKEKADKKYASKWTEKML